MKPADTNLREELARQGLLLEFIAECVALGTVADIAKLVTSRLHWICDLDTCGVLLPGADTSTLWSSDRRAGATGRIAEPSLLALHEELLRSAMATGVPSLSDRARTDLFLVALPLGTHTRSLGALCLSRAARGFTQNDLRHLQHACNALGGALTRIAAITAEQEAERAVKQAESQLRSAAEDRALLAEQMVGIVSHDLRNPLAAILMGTTLMARGEPLAPQKLRVLQRVQGATDRARRLVDELLDFTQARVGAGLALKIGAVDLDELIASSVQELGLSFPTMTLRYDDGGGLGTARLDGDRLQQLLGNLVANAVTYGATGRPIELNCRVSDGQLHLSVANEGAPVSEALLATMFEPMVRGTQDGSGNRSVGLGLYIVRAIAEGHGGRVDVVSDATDGTTFTVRMPIDRG